MDFFFLKRKTAYELRISDWSSDVCTSDLGAANASSTGEWAWSRSGLNASMASPIRAAKAPISRSSPIGLMGLGGGTVRKKSNPSTLSRAGGAAPWRGPVTAATVQTLGSSALRIARVRKVELLRRGQTWLRTGMTRHPSF